MQREYLEKNELLRTNEELTSKITLKNSMVEPGNYDRDYFERQLRGYIEQSQKDSHKLQELVRKNQEHEDIYSELSAEIMRLNQVLG